MKTVTFPKNTYASAMFAGRPLHERMVKLAAGHTYEVVGEMGYTTAHSDMAESVKHHSALLIKSRRNGTLWVESSKALP